MVLLLDRCKGGVENSTGPLEQLRDPSIDVPIHRDQGSARTRPQRPLFGSLLRGPGYGDKNITLLICWYLPDLKLGALPRRV